MSPIAAHADEFIKAAQENGEPIPEGLIAPVVPQEAGAAYVAERALRGEASSFPLHQVVEGQLRVFNQRGSIPFTSIDAYANRYGIEGDEFDRLIYFIRIIEGVQRRQGQS